MKSAIFGVVFLAIAFLSYSIFKTESERRVLKEDLVELSKAKYGLFNVDEWRKILSDVIRSKIDQFDLNANGNEAEMRTNISRFLNNAIDNFEQNFNRTASPLESFGASAINLFGRIKEQIPRITEDVMTFMNDPANRDKVKTMVIQKLDEYADSTFKEVDYSEMNRILSKYEQTDRQHAIELLKGEISEKESGIFKTYSISLIVVLMLLAAWLMFGGSNSNVEYTMIVAICFCLLLFGVMLPMIEIDARISSISFTLLGEKISFGDQVLYYKSKSILEVVTLMLQNGRLDVLFVGALVLLFSVLFPVSKLVCSIIYVYRPEKRGKFLDFMVFKTGKWSMADVMVVAIFMSYIGFTGIVSDQLRQLEGITDNLDILTTNKSNLQFGFYLFTAFTVISLIVSQKIQRQFKG